MRWQDERLIKVHRVRRQICLSFSGKKCIFKKIDFQEKLEETESDYIDSIFSEYLEITVQFAFIILFGNSMPLLPILTYFNNVFEVYVDKEKQLRFLRRPIPKNTADIGAWYFVLEITSYASVFLSVGILIYTTNSYYEMSTFWKLVFFTLMVLGFLFIKMFIAALIPDEEEKYVQLQKRHEYIKEKITMNYSRNIEEFEKTGREINNRVFGSN